jgi:hypothetical protein
MDYRMAQTTSYRDYGEMRTAHEIVNALLSPEEQSIRASLWKDENQGVFGFTHRIAHLPQWLNEPTYSDNLKLAIAWDNRFTSLAAQWGLQHFPKVILLPFVQNFRFTIEVALHVVENPQVSWEVIDMMGKSMPNHVYQTFLEQLPLTEPLLLEAVRSTQRFPDLPMKAELIRRFLGETTAGLPDGWLLGLYSER